MVIFGDYQNDEIEWQQGTSFCQYLSHCMNSRLSGFTLVSGFANYPKALE